MTTYRLSKSRLTSFRQCPKRLWLEVHKPGEKLESLATLAAFATGHQVGEIAQRAYPDGLLIAPDNDLARALTETQELLPLGRPLFEATFVHEGVLVRVDLLLPQDAGWHMAEVKSSTSVKDYHLHDVATQLWVARACGLPVARASLRHVSNRFVLETPGDYTGLLSDADVSGPAAELLPGLPQTVAQASSTLEGGEPDIAVGGQCTKPFDCPFQAYCNRDLSPGPTYPIALLPGAGGRNVAGELAAAGYADLALVPAHRIRGPLLLRIHAATLTGKPYRDAMGAAQSMANWGWPRYFLDFETIAFAVPIWIGTRPYEQVPFQFSCHRLDQDGVSSHTMFLDLSGQDPGLACAKALLDGLGTEGAMVAYNAGFERACLQRLAERFPQFASGLQQIARRVVDLLPVVRHHYYHRDMRGSYSIKAVLPTLVPQLSYQALDGVQDGTMAQAAYLEAVAPDCDPVRREQLSRQLSEYCKLDTWAMVELARALAG
jgi:hypothetical protein